MNYQSNPLTKVLFLVPTLVVAGLITTAAPGQPFTLRHTFDDPTVTTEDRFGSPVVLDGDRMLIGGPWDNTHGAGVGQAHLFDATTGNLLWTFDDPTPTPDGNSQHGGDRFGYSVTLDSNRVLIGDPWDDTQGDSVGQAHLFDTSGNLLWTFDDPTPTLPYRGMFGRSVALDGSHILIAAPGDSSHGVSVGQVHLFDTSGNLLHAFDDPTPTTNGFFGLSVALDGNRVLIGDRLSSQAHLFDTSGILLQTFDDPTVTTQDRFGNSVALDGNRVLISAPWDDTHGEDVGQAHLFDTSGNLLQTFDDPTVTTEDSFGYSVALDGNRVLIGAYHDDTYGEDVGQAHLFDTSGNLLQTFDDPTVTTGDGFGSIQGGVALDGNRILIGAYKDDTYGEDVGQAYLFTPACDFNSDAECDIDDLNSMLAEGPIALGVTVTPGVNDQFDLTGDGVIDNADVDQWLADSATVNGLGSPYKRADANLDGVVDGQDFILWNGGKFTSTLLWDFGDWNGDGVADGQDFIIWNGNKFTSSAGVNAVPEPGAAMLLLVGLVLLGMARVRR